MNRSHHYAAKTETAARIARTLQANDETRHVIRETTRSL